MVEIKLKDGQSGYSVIGEYIRRYWKYHFEETVIVSIRVSYDGKYYDNRTDIAYPDQGGDIEYLSDWWEGEKYIQLHGIQSIYKINVIGGIYADDQCEV